MKFRSKKKDTREATLLEIENAITLAVRMSNPDCEKFVRVIAEKLPARRGRANWRIRGVQYGKAPRAQCDTAIQAVLGKLQLHFLVVEEPSNQNGNK